MKMTKLAFVVAAAALSGSAMALPTNATIGLEMLVSGATAQEKQIESAFFSYCDIATADKYTIVGDTAEGWAITCTSNATAPQGAGVNMMLRKENGGSSTGVEEVSFGSNLDVVLVDANCSATTTLANGVQDHSCPNSASIPAQVGISDVEPELFAAAVNGPKAVDVNGPLEVSPINITTFGTVVSPDMYEALQAAQGLTVGSNNVANMPSLSSALIGNLFAGNVQEWSTLYNGASPLTAGQGLTSEKVNLCIRKPGSGTQAQFAAFYLQNPCLGSGAKDFALDADGTVSEGSGASYAAPSVFGSEQPGPHVYYNNGSSDLGRCMTGVAGRNAWAIGFQALEKVKEADVLKNTYKFVRVDGVAPTLENVAAGLYRNWSAASYQINTDNTTGNAYALATDLRAKLQAKADVEANNATFKVASYDPLVNIPTILDGTGNPADVGNLAVASVSGNGNASSPFDATNPVMPYNKGTASLATCSVANLGGSVIDVTVQ